MTIVYNCCSLCNEYLCISSITRFITILSSFIAQTKTFIQPSLSAFEQFDNSHKDYHQLLQEKSSL